MAVASIGNAAIRPLFELLYKGVEQAMERTTRFKSLIENRKSTLDPLRPWFRGDRNGLKDLSGIENKTLVVEINKSIRLVGKVSNFHIWNYWYIDDYINQIVGVGRYFSGLIKILRINEARDWICRALNVRHMFDKMRERESVLVNKLEQLGREKCLDKLEQEEVFSWHLMDMFKWSDRGFRILPSQIEEAHPIDDDDDDALQYAYWILFSNIELGEYKSAAIFKPLLGDLRATIDRLGQDKPPRSNDEDHSKEELEKFRVEMEKGAEMVRKCCKVGESASYNTKFKYINQLLGLNQSLRRWVDGRTALEEFLERVSRDLREAWAKMRNRDAKLDEIERDLAVQNETQDKDSLPQRNKLGM